MRAAIDSFLPPKVCVNREGLDEFMGIIDARIESEIEERSREHDDMEIAR